MYKHIYTHKYTKYICTQIHLGINSVYVHMYTCAYIHTYTDAHVLTYLF